MPGKRSLTDSARDALAPTLGIAALVLAWALAVGLEGTVLLPGPARVGRSLVELAKSGALARHVVASLYRTTWGFFLGASLAIPAGLALGWYRPWEWALGPLIQVLRPISPLAWIPLAILWFGVGDLPAVFIIFLGTFLPLTVTAVNAVRSVSETHVRVGRNFGLGAATILARIVLPATVEQLFVGLRLALGVAWLVVVAAEMIAVNSGLGFLIIDARNAGDRYDLVVGGMVLIGIVGLALDVVMRRLARVEGAPARVAALGEGS
jgi:NitT/TauT family transport system permease protein